MNLEASTIVKAASGAVGIAVAASSRVFGKKLDWLPLEESSRKLAFRVTMVLAAVLIVLIWFVSERVEPITLVVIALILLVVTVVAYVSLRGILRRVTYSRKTSENESVPVLGGFELTDQAEAALKLAPSVQDVFAGMTYKPERVWTAKSLAATEMLVTGLFVTLFACGSTGFATLGLAIGTSNENGTNAALATIQAAAVEEKVGLKAFLEDVGKRTDAYPRAQLRLRGCVIRVVVRVNSNPGNGRMTVGGRMFSSANDSPIALTDSTLPVVSHVFAPTVPDSTTTQIWLQVPREPEPVYAKVAVRRLGAESALDTRQTGVFTFACSPANS